MPTNPLEPELVRGEPQLPGITVRPTEPPDGGPCWCCVVKKTTHALSIHRLEDFPLGLPHMMVSLCVECYCEVSQFVQKRREELWVKTADEATKP